MKKNHPMTEEEIESGNQRKFITYRIADLEEKLARMTTDRNKVQALLEKCRENYDLNKSERYLQKKALKKMTADRDWWKDTRLREIISKLAGPEARS